MTVDCRSDYGLNQANHFAMSTLAELHERIWRWEARNNNFQKKREEFAVHYTPPLSFRVLPFPEYA